MARISARRLRQPTVSQHLRNHLELSAQNFVVREAKGLDASHLFEPRIAAKVFVSIVAGTIDLDDEVRVRQVEVGDAVERRAESLLEPILLAII
jgi:DNA-binding transcriptional ArsR family regulator